MQTMPLYNLTVISRNGKRAEATVAAPLAAIARRMGGALARIIGGGVVIVKRIDGVTYSADRPTVIHNSAHWG